MADNGNRGPNDSFRRSGRRRREPPIIDAAATELPPDQGATSETPGPPVSATGETPVPPVSDAAPSSPPTGGEAAMPAEAQPQVVDATDSSPSPIAMTGGTEHDAAAAEAIEPVLFGSAARRPEPKDELVSTPPEGPAETPSAEAVDASHGPRDAEPLDPVSMEPAQAVDQDAPRAADPAPSNASSRPSNVNTLTGVLGVAALILLGIIGWLVFSGGQRGNDLVATVTDLKTRLAALEARPDGTALQSQVAALDKRVASAESDRAALGKQVAALSARIDSAGQTAPSSGSSGSGATAPAPKPADAAGGQAPSGQTSAVPALVTMAAVAALATKIDGIDGRVTALSADQSGTAKAVAALPKPVAPDFGPVNAKVAGLETEINAVDAKINGSDARFNGFDARINGIEAKVNGFGTTMNALSARMNGLESKVDDGAAKTAKLQSDLTNLPKVDLGPLQARTAALDGRLAKVEADLAAPKDGARVTEVRAVGSADLSRATTIAVVGETIERAIAAGTPYGSEIDALKALGADPALVARLGPASAGGAPSVDALTSQWDAVRGSVLATEKPIAPGAGGTFNRFLSSATSIVQVHPVGAVAGAGVTALVSQIDAALGQGDVQAALAAWDKLSDAGKAASQVWADAARSRVDALGAAGDLVQGAIATLGRPPE